MAEEILPHLGSKGLSLYSGAVPLDPGLSYSWKDLLHIHSIQALHYSVSFNAIPLILLNSIKSRPRVVKYTSYVTPFIPGIILVNLLWTLKSSRQTPIWSIVSSFGPRI